MPYPFFIETLEDPQWDSLGSNLRSIAPVSVLTGAGVSAESGLPTFRANGLWETFRVEDVATPDAFARDPALVWRFYNYRRAMVASASPNDAHRALVEWESLRPGQFTLITQNVDGLHQAAGSRSVVELHGSLRRVRCTGCGHSITSIDPLPETPRCECGQLLRPDVVWFGETLPVDAFVSAQRAIDRAGLLVVVGTSAVVYPAAGLILEAKERRAFMIEINPVETDATYLMDAVLRGPAAKMLPQLVAKICGSTANGV